MSILVQKYAEEAHRSSASEKGLGSSSHVKTLSRHSSKDMSEDGCCLAKVFLSNIIAFATRSRRKGVNGSRQTTRRASQTEAMGDVVKYCTHASDCKRRALSEMGVCDSYDEEMLKQLTVLPQGMNKNEWLATHTLSLFENVNALCGTISELCTPVSCPIMSYPGVPKAYWVDEKRKQHPYSAMQYIDCVLSFCEVSSKDEQLYPTKYGSAFAPHFDAYCRRVMRLLWHSCGHLYTNHWEQLGYLNLRSHLSLVLAHMHSIAKVFDLLDGKELATLARTVELVRPAAVYHRCARSANNMAGDCAFAWASAQFPCSKSGSWGGHPTANTLISKPYSQTC